MDDRQAWREGAQVLGEHEHERTWLLDAAPPWRGRWVLKVFEVGAGPGALDDPRVAAIEGVPAWCGVWPLDAEAVAALGLRPGRWMAGARPFVVGRTLEELAREGALRAQWPALALGVGQRLVELHERGWPHADLQPRNVVVGPDGALWLIDVPLLASSDDTLRVLGSAPTMAPELWRGEAPTTASDVYALAALVCWMATSTYPWRADSLRGWMIAHTEHTPSLPDTLDARLRGVLRRALDAEAARRPPLQELLDALRTPQATPPHAAPLTITWPPLHHLAASLAASPTTRLVTGPRGAGLSALAEEICVRLELSGREVALIRGDGGVIWRTRDVFCSGTDRARRPRRGPWRGVLELIDALQARAGVSGAVVLPPGVGDRAFVFARLTAAIDEAARAVGGVVVVWDDWDQASADVRDWWHHARDAGVPVTLIATSHAAPERWPEDARDALPQPSAEDWLRWRAATLRVEVGDLARGRFEQIIADAPGSLGGALDALGEALGLSVQARSWRGGVDERVVRATAEEIAELLEQGAHASAALHAEALLARQDASAEDEHAALELWIEAVRRAGGASCRADALEQTLRARQQAAAPEQVARCAIQLARLHASLGQHAEGLRALDASAPATVMQAQEAAAWRAQLLLSSGRFAEAQEIAAEALSREVPSEALPQLRVVEAGARAVRGDAAAVELLRELVSALPREPSLAPLRARAHAYSAIGLTQLDQHDDALDAHLRALEEIEAAGLHAELPTYLLNVGVAYHKQGRFGVAHEYYARGSRTIQPSTRASTRALLWLNRANIDLEIGRLDEAAAALEQAEAVIAASEGLGKQAAVARSLRASLRFYGGELDAALAEYHAALQEEDAQRPYRRAELWLCCAEVELERARHAGARAALDAARQLIDQHDLEALRDLHGILRARTRWADGLAAEVMVGVEQAMRALRSAQEAANHFLIVRQAPHLREILQREGLSEQLPALDTLQNTSHQAVAMGLTRELREVFIARWPALADEAAPAHAPAVRPEVVAPRHAATAALLEPFYRMLSFNEVILHARDLDTLWRDALEIAAQLSGAERAFLLTRQDSGQYTMAASRDTRGEPIPQGHLKVSVTIAEEAARTGRTVVTVNARDDARFQAALSVVHQDLMSVLCVPVRDASGLLGALYLDHRFQPGTFAGEVPRMMEAFGHQLALAITNTQRALALERERAELGDARERLAGLLEEREAMVAGLHVRVAQLSEEVARQRHERGSTRAKFPDIAHGSAQMERLLAQLERVARSDIPVIIEGESGTGKELIARALHQASARAAGPFVPINCGAISEALFESELFGHLRGAFTGATLDREGLLQSANGGTIFLDEVGELPLSMQVKLLRVLQERKVRRVGATRQEPIDVRVVAATHRDLDHMVREGTFREDLFYRLAAFTVRVPALRERREDILLIAHHLLETISHESGGRRLRLGPEAAQLLASWSWPGNVRELENTLRAASVLCDAEEISPRELAPVLRMREPPPSRDTSPRALPTRAPLTRTGRAETRGRKPKADPREIRAALDGCDGDVAAAADVLGVSVRTMYRYIKRLDGL